MTRCPGDHSGETCSENPRYDGTFGECTFKVLPTNQERYAQVDKLDAGKIRELLVTVWELYDDDDLSAADLYEQLGWTLEPLLSLACEAGLYGTEEVAE